MLQVAPHSELKRGLMPLFFLLTYAMTSLLSAPTVTYCEAAVAGLIARPGYAVSNIPYIIIGVYLLIKYRNTGLAKFFGASSIAIGVASFFYDASFTFASQLIDLMAMFSFIAILTVINLNRVKKLSYRSNLIIVLGLLATYFLAIYVLQGSTGRILFGIVAIFNIGCELYLWLKYRNYQLSYWIAGIVLFIAGFGIWLLDANKIWCDPSNLFNGRAIYHYLTAVTIFLLFKHYQSLPDHHAHK